MSTRYLFPRGESLLTPTFHPLPPCSFCNLSVSPGIVVDSLSQIGEEALCSFVGEVLGMPKSKLPPLLGMVDQKTGSEVIFGERLTSTDLPEERRIERLGERLLFDIVRGKMAKDAGFNV